MDITDQILAHHQVYGSSDFTAQFATASSRSLNYANGASIQRPEQERVTTIPRSISYQDAVGLFGAENHFVKVTAKIQNPVSACYEEPGWECARLSEETVDPNDDYTLDSGNGPIGQAYVDNTIDKDPVNTFEPAAFLQNSAFGLSQAYVKVDLNNLKTGNKYIDSWLDVRLYKKNRDEHPYDVMYIAANDYFYIGFHARNTKRLPYNVSCILGQNSAGTSDGYLRKQEVPEELLNSS